MSQGLRKNEKVRKKWTVFSCGVPSNGSCVGIEDNLHQGCDTQRHVQSLGSMDQDRGTFVLETLRHDTGPVQHLGDRVQPATVFHSRQPLVHAHVPIRARVQQFGQRVVEIGPAFQGMVDAAPLGVVHFQLVSSPWKSRKDQIHPWIQSDLPVNSIKFD